MKEIIKFKEVEADKDCFINTIGYKEALKVQKRLKDHECKLMQLDIVDTEEHAICVFKYKGSWYVYDRNAGAYSIGKFKKEPTPEQVLRRMPNDIYDNMLNPKWIEN